MKNYLVVGKLVSYWIKPPGMNETRGYTVKTIRFNIKAKNGAHARRKVEWRQKQRMRFYDNSVLTSARIYRVELISV